jgi:Tfp pilus assembly protein PilF
MRRLTLISATVLLLPPACGQSLVGRVAMEDGGAPPDRIEIQSVCGGISRRETYTDKKGGFNIGALGGTDLGVVQDAAGGAQSRVGATRDNPFGDCTLRAVLTGYKSDVVSLGNRQSGNPDVGTLVLHKAGASTSPNTTATSEKAPRDAKKAFDIGEEAMRNRKPDEAILNLQKAVAIYPQYALAWLDLGRLQAAKNDTGAARKSFEAAVRADPQFAPPFMQIMMLDARISDYKALAESSERFLKVDPVGYPAAYVYNSIANLNLQNVAAAEKSAREGQKVDIKHENPKLWWLLGGILANRGEFSAAVEEYRKYLEYAPSASDAASTRAMLAEVEKLAAEKK